ncbi:MAG: endonuclease/exonuclease/phosphatase family protein [Nitrospiria bacterium]
MIGRIEGTFLNLRRRLSRSEWLVRLLGLSKAEGAESEVGIVLIQIDGLSRPQLEKALQKRRMPFLKRLLRREGYDLHTLYSGLPSNTPAFQAELFYGQRQCVPAFSYRDHETGELMRMHDPAAAAKVQAKLEKEGEGLLKGGSAYSNIFSGGAAESAFCPATLDWSRSLRGANPFSMAVFILWNGWSFIRVGVLLILELVLALSDFVRGLIEGQDLWKELRFVPARVAVSILLRELVTMNAMLDAARGLPEIHLNFVGYDEQAHRRGPSSAFANWTLKGIDDAIKRVWKAAKRSGRRDYEIWVYSDHGQESSTPYEVAHGRSIEAAVCEIFEQQHRNVSRQAKSVQLQRATWLSLPIGRWLFGLSVEETTHREKTVVEAMGPVGHVYSPLPLTWEERLLKAKDLVEKAKVPMVALTRPDDAVLMMTADGLFRPQEEAVAVFGADHPYLEAIAEDTAALCRHPDSGDFVLFGWSKTGPSLSFPGENGSHAGPGPKETTGFALLPGSAPITLPERGPLRARDLREGVLQFLGRSPGAFPGRRRQRSQKQRTLRIMTYNVHSCIGMDGKLSPDRIARIIAQYDPDIVALQELDAGRPRTAEIDQAETIARTLSMDFHFHPSIQIKEEKYGNAVLSHHSIRLVRADKLPGLKRRPLHEPRGALWVGVQIAGREYQLINTHFGLSPQERLLQCEALLGPGWLGHEDCREPVILCGDFNARPRSLVCRRISGSFQDAQDALSNHRPKSTWFGRYPIHRIDHVFIGPSMKVSTVDVPRTALTRRASDHLPLIVDIGMK